MPARSRTIGPDVSRGAAGNIKRQRERLGWSRVEMSRRMHLAGYRMSTAVITNIESGIPAVNPATGMYHRRVRLLSVDELVSFAEVLGVSPGMLLDDMKENI